MNNNEKNNLNREQEIIEAAQDVFALYGYEKVTMDDVAAKLNIKRSALYYYYKSKDDLFVALGEYEFRKYEKEVQIAVSSAGSTDEKFAAFCRTFLPLRKRFRDLYKLASEDFPFSFETHKKLKTMIGDIHVAVIKDIFLNDKKTCNIENIEFYSVLLNNSIRGVVFNSYNISIEQLEYNIIKLCKIFSHGLREADVVKNDHTR